MVATVLTGMTGRGEETIELGLREEAVPARDWAALDNNLRPGAGARLFKLARHEMLGHRYTWIGEYRFAREQEEPVHGEVRESGFVGAGVICRDEWVAGGALLEYLDALHRWISDTMMRDDVVVRGFKDQIADARPFDGPLKAPLHRVDETSAQLPAKCGLQPSGQTHAIHYETGLLPHYLEMAQIADPFRGQRQIFLTDSDEQFDMMRALQLHPASHGWEFAMREGVRDSAVGDLTSEISQGGTAEQPERKPAQAENYVTQSSFMELKNKHETLRSDFDAMRSQFLSGKGHATRNSIQSENSNLDDPRDYGDPIPKNRRLSPEIYVTVAVIFVIIIAIIANLRR